MLSCQQNKCLRLLSRGMTYKEIGRALGLSARTVESYIALIRRKTNLHSRSSLVAFFLDQEYEQKEKSKISA